MTYKEALQLAKTAPNDSGRFWLLSVLSVSYVTLLAHPQTALTLEQENIYQSGLARLVAGYPLAYLLGSAYFMGRAFIVTPEVLIPREDSAPMVEYAALFLHRLIAPDVLELGTGSGILGISLFLLASHIQSLSMTDQSIQALAIAQSNANHYAVPHVAYHHDWYSRWSFPHLFDCIMANPPYLASTDPYLPELRDEPRMALVSEQEGFADVAHIIRTAYDWLKPGGLCVCEHAWYHSDRIAQAYYEAGYTRIESLKDHTYKTIHSVGYHP